MAARRRTIPYEPGLDGLRAVAVTGVLLFHVFALSGYHWFRGGGLGVSVFFTLSGFLITTLLVREHEQSGGLDLHRFWGRRVQRLVAASLTVVLVVVLLSWQGTFDARASDALAAIWSVTNWHVILGGEGDLLQTIVGPLGPTWSLAVEEQFYVGLAIAAWFAVRSRAPRRTLAIVFAAAIVVSLVLANTISDWSPQLEFGTLVRMGELAVGGLLALVWVHRGDDWRGNRGLRVAGWVAFAVLWVAFWWFDYTPPWLLRGGFTVMALVWATLVAAIMAGGGVARLLSLRPCVAVGRWSYSLYLVHWPVYLLVTPDRMHVGRAAIIPIRLAFAFAAALALHVGVEQPIRRRSIPPRRAIAGWLVASLAASAFTALVLG